MREEVLELEKAEMEAVLGRILRAGIILSILLLGAGILLYLVQGGQAIGFADLENFHLMAWLTSHAPWDGVTLMIAGLALLILTPIFRVLATFLIFLKERDRLYIAFTAVVMVIILISILMAFIVEPK